MRSAALFCAVLVAIAAGAVLAGLASSHEIGKFLLIALLWYPIDRFFTYVSGWNPRPPPDQDRT